MAERARRRARTRDAAAALDPATAAVPDAEDEALRAEMRAALTAAFGRLRLVPGDDRFFALFDQAAANAMQSGLFDMGGEPSQGHDLVDEAMWSDKKRLQEEKSALGFYLSGHLFDAYKGEVRRFVRQKIGELKEGRDKLVAGVITTMRTQMTQRGKMLDHFSERCVFTADKIHVANAHFTQAHYMFALTHSLI